MTITDGKPETTGDMGKDIENIKAWSSELVKQTQGYAGPESRVGPFQQMFGKTQDTQDQIASTIRMNNNETVMKPSAVLANLIALGVVKYQAEAGLYYVAIPIALLAVATLFTVLKIAAQENKSK
jgi:hypothetical protein